MQKKLDYLCFTLGGKDEREEDQHISMVLWNRIQIVRYKYICFYSCVCILSVFIHVCVFNVYLCIYYKEWWWWFLLENMRTFFFAHDFVKFIHDQFFERGRNVMIIVYNRNTSTWNPGSDETDIFRQQSPARIWTVKTYIVLNRHPRRQFPVTTDLEYTIQV